MHEAYETVALQRDVIGILIPAGTRVELPEGAAATITQALGGSYTVQVEGHLFRIDGRDADALGREPVAMQEVPADAGDADIERAVWDALRTCYDPEIPVNVVDLGLVYDCEVHSGEGGRRTVNVRMTLTAPGCGMGEFLIGDVRDKLLNIPTVHQADVQLVFDPPWTQDMMSETAQLQLGMLQVSDTITRGVRIVAVPRYVSEQSVPERDEYLFAYEVRISNEGDGTVQLLSRRWLITSGDGQVQEVRGQGVVGRQPVLAPGETFEYTSACPLGTPVGTMHGSFRMLRIDTGEQFDATIRPFTLSVPRALN